MTDPLTKAKACGIEFVVSESCCNRVFVIPAPRDARETLKERLKRAVVIVNLADALERGEEESGGKTD
jgi:hypothetical protein